MTKVPRHAETAPPRRRAASLAVGLVALVGWAASAGGCQGGGLLRVEGPLRGTTAPLATDAWLEVARRFAPVVYHAVHPTEGRQDLPTRVDFDGDLRGAGNWDAMAAFELPPVVYYAALETETHLFLTYHLFHPRDWSYVRAGFHETHENDGENLQVVVDKASGRPVLLTTQAHYFSDVYAARGAGFRAGCEPVQDVGLLLHDDEGRVDAAGLHVGVFVQDYGHGIYGALDTGTGLAFDAAGQVTFPDHGLVLRAARPGEGAPEPDLARAARRPAGTVPYHLASTTAGLWPLLARGDLVGEGALLDGAVPLDRPGARVLVPRYYEAARFSGPFGPDRGISPFAFDFSFYQGQIGALFFDPAGRYPEGLDVPRPWSTRYLGDPFAAIRGGADAR